MNYRHGIRSIVVAAAVMALPLIAEGKLSRTDASTASFTASGPAGMNIVGTTSDLIVTDDADAVTVTVPLANLSTGIGLRDRHMREKYLQVQSYPNAALRVTRADLPLPAVGAQSGGDAKGTMTIHGQSRPVTFHYGVKHEGPRYTVTGSLRINMTDYGIPVPSYLGVSVKPDVDLAVSFKAKEDS